MFQSLGQVVTVVDVVDVVVVVVVSTFVYLHHIPPLFLPVAGTPSHNTQTMINYHPTTPLAKLNTGGMHSKHLRFIIKNL